MRRERHVLIIWRNSKDESEVTEFTSPVAAIGAQLNFCRLLQNSQLGKLFSIDKQTKQE